MVKIRRMLVISHIGVGLGAMAGGLCAITDPLSPMGMPLEALEHSPFNSFLIPGLILFGLIGVGNLACALLYRVKCRCQGYASSVVGWALSIWIIVQCIMLQAVVFLHVLFFLIGVFQAVLAASILLENRQFPANVVSALLHRGKTP